MIGEAVRFSLGPEKWTEQETDIASILLSDLNYAPAH
jgi:hypothetical protein